MRYLTRPVSCRGTSDIMKYHFYLRQYHSPILFKTQKPKTIIQTSTICICDLSFVDDNYLPNFITCKQLVTIINFYKGYYEIVG